jgi:hypothetical protein
MIIGHLPAGYVLSRLGYLRFRRLIDNYRKFMFWGVFGSIAPDLDMVYFHLVDGGRVHHHKYFSHYPVLWLALAVIAAVFCLGHSARGKVGIYALVFAVAGFCHLMLDTIVGDIWWFAPFVDQPFALATVPAIYKPWWLNFFLHWSFLLEIAVIVWAVWLGRRPPESPRPGAAPAQQTA